MNFPLTKNSPITIEAFMIQNHLVFYGKRKLDIDGKIGPQTLKAVNETITSAFPYVYNSIQPDPNEINKLCFDKLLSVSYKTPNPFMDTDVNTVAKLYGDAAKNMGIILTALANNTPKSSKIKKTDTERFTADVQEILDKYNNSVKMWNTWFTNKKYFGSVVLQNETDETLKMATEPYKDKLLIPAAGLDSNVFASNLNSQKLGNAGFYSHIKELTLHTGYIAAFFTKFYNISYNNMDKSNTNAPAIDLFGKPTDTNSATNKTSSETTDLMDKMLSIMMVGGLMYVGVTVMKDFRAENRKR